MSFWEETLEDINYESTRFPFFQFGTGKGKITHIPYPKYPLLVFWELPVFFPIMVVIIVAYAYSFNLFFHYVI